MLQNDQQNSSRTMTADATAVVGRARTPAPVRLHSGVAEALAEVRQAQLTLCRAITDGKKRKDTTAITRLGEMLGYALERLEQAVLAEQCELGLGAGAVEDSNWRFELWFIHGDTAFHGLSTHGVAKAAWDAARASLAEQQAEALQAAA